MHVAAVGSLPESLTCCTARHGWRDLKPRRGGREHDVTNRRKRARSAGSKDSRIDHSHCDGDSEAMSKKRLRG